MRVLLSCISIGSMTFTLAQYSFTSPISAAYDPVYDTYYVAETGLPWAIHKIENGVPQSWLGTIFEPRDMLVKGDTLFLVHASGGLVAIQFPSTSPDINVNVGFGQVLWGLATDGPFLYATDRDDRSIWKIDAQDGSNVPLSLSLSWEPCAIVYDQFNDRLLVGAWGANAGIYSVDPNTGIDSLLVQTSFTNIHGITVDCHGRILISTWFPDQITAYDPSFTGAEEVLFSGLNNPGFIHFDPYNDDLLIPNTQSGLLSLEFINCFASISEATNNELSFFPNPADQFIQFDQRGSEMVEFVDVAGRSVLKTYALNGWIDISTLQQGTYYVQFGKKTIKLMVM